MADEHDEPTMPAADLNYPETLRLTLSDAESMFENALETAEEINSGGPIQPEGIRAFQDIDDLRVLLTDRRLEVLRAIHDDPPKSISALADRLGRAYSVVHEDVTILAEHHVVHFREGPRGAKQPYVPYEMISVDIPLVGSPVIASSMSSDSAQNVDQDEEKEQWLQNADDPRSETHS